jgi:xanthosine utilization system XapX-like protein
MDRDEEPVAIQLSSPYKPYVAGLLGLIAVMVGAQALLLQYDVKKCEVFHATLNKRFENLPPKSQPQDLVEAKERISEILQSDPAGCKNVGSQFNAVIEKCMTILFSLITGASIAAGSMTTLSRPVSYKGRQEN